MTLILEQPLGQAPRSIAGGEAPLGDVFRLSRDSMRFIDNPNADYSALVEAYDRRIRDIAASTGQVLENPLTAAENEFRRRQAQPQSPIGILQRPQETHRQIAERLQAGFAARLSELARKHPEAADTIAADRPLTDDALGIMRQTEENLTAAMSSRGGVGKWLAVLSGGFTGMLRDPVNVGSLFLGGGPGAARTVVGRIATVAAKEATINASIEAAMQPVIQARRARAGLPSGFEEAARNVAFAALFGGTIGGAARGAGEGFDRFFRPKQRGIVEQIRASQPAEIRGAIDAAEVLDHTDQMTPVGLSARVHENAVTRAEQIVSEPIAPAPALAIDTDKVARIAARIVGNETDAVRAIETHQGPRSLVEFLADAGGIRDQVGELEAIGARELRGRRRKRLVRDDGEPLDRARERAAEAGYFDDLYGTPDAAVERSSVVDLLTALDREARGQRVFPAGGGERVDAGDLVDGNRAFVESRIDELLEVAGPGVDDAVIARAFELTQDRGMAADDAVYEAVLEIPLNDTGRSGKPLPGWDDESLERAAGDARGDRPAGGLDDPSRPIDDDLLNEVDLIENEQDLASFDVDGLVKDIEHTEDLARVVEACRT